MITDTLPSCHLCGSKETFAVVSRQTDYLRRQWSTIWRLDVSREFSQIEQLQLRECHRCGLQFFRPAVAGTGLFYEKLQRIDSYYVDDKPEYDYGLADIHSGDRLLEVGCGRGNFLQRVRQHGVAGVGIELNTKAVAEARQRGLDVEAADLKVVADRYPGQFDVVCHFQVLEHVPDPLDFLTHCCRLLRRGGRLLVATPNADSFMRYSDSHLINVFDWPPHHVLRWRERSLRCVAQLLPLEVERVVCEPLQELHRHWYVSTQMNRWGMNRQPLRLLRRPVRSIAHTLLRPLAVRRLVRGHTIYVCYRKTTSPRPRQITAGLP